MIIYKHTNKINGLSYIGLTKYTMEERLQGHIIASNIPLTTFHKAIDEFGIENFTSEILEHCTELNLGEREKYWIEYFDTINNGYNMKQGSSKYKPRTQTGKNEYNTNVSIIKDYIKLRFKNDSTVTELKKEHAKQKSHLIYNLKQIHLVSIQKINFHITLYKNELNDDNIEEISNKTFDSLINSFGTNCDIYYRNNKDKILYYISECYRMILEVNMLIKGFNTELNNFIKINNINKYSLVKYVSIYNDLKTDIVIYTEYCKNIDEFNSYKAKHSIDGIKEQLFLEEIELIDKRRISRA